MFNQPLLPCRGSAVQAAARGGAVPGCGLHEYSVVAKRLALRAIRALMPRGHTHPLAAPQPSVQRRKVWLTPTTRVPCSNAAKTRISSKFAGRSSPYYQDVWRRYCCLTIFSPIVDTFLISQDITRQNCAIVQKWRFLRPVFPASRAQHISDLHYKFALGHTMCRSMVDIQKKEEERKKLNTTGRAYNGLPYYIGQSRNVVENKFRMLCSG